MFLALTALMLHVSAGPQLLTPRVLALTGAAAGIAAAATAPVGSAASDATSESDAAPTMAPDEAPVAAPAGPAPFLDSAPQPEAAALAYAPGRLTPEPIGTAAPAPAKPAFQPFARGPAEPVAVDRAHRRIWMGLSVAQHSAAAFDAWSTRRVISSGAGQELNPMLRPFASNASLYAAIQVGPAILDYVSYRMMHSEHGWARRTWWVPQAIGTAVSIASGVHNLGVYSAR